MFTESVPFYFLTILMVKKWGRRRFLHSLGLGFIIMLGLHLAVFTLIAAIYSLAFSNQASITLTMKAFAISTSYILWHSMYYNQRKDMETYPFHEHDEWLCWQALASDNSCYWRLQWKCISNQQHICRLYLVILKSKYVSYCEFMNILFRQLDQAPLFSTGRNSPCRLLWVIIPGGYCFKWTLRKTWWVIYASYFPNLFNDYCPISAKMLVWHSLNLNLRYCRKGQPKRSRFLGHNSRRNLAETPEKHRSNTGVTPE